MAYLMALLFCLHILGSTVVLCINFVDYFGTVIVQADEAQDFACEATGDDQAEFFWTLGDRKLENSPDVGQSITSSSLLHLRLLPTVEDDGSQLSCWEGEEYDSNILSVYKLKILDASEFDDDISTELSVDAAIFPPPHRTDITWKIEGGGEDLEALILHPGSADVEETFLALPVQEMGDNTYRLILNIQEQEPGSHLPLTVSIFIQSDVGGLVTHHFLPKDRDVQDEEVLDRSEVQDGEMQDREVHNDTAKEGAAVQALQIPFWIWICAAVMAVVFAAIFAIIYVAVVRRRKPAVVAVDTTTTAPGGGNIYIRVSNREL